jgi:putative inorganic carbon (HCO3(-)) transporter
MRAVRERSNVRFESGTLPHEPAARRLRRGVGARVTQLAPVGFPLLLLLLWLILEFGRPPQLLKIKIPMLISAASFGMWVLRPRKQWRNQNWWLLAFLAVMVVNVPLAENNYWAFMGMKTMAIIFLCICFPLQSLLTSVKRVKVWSYVFIGVVAYVAIWSLLHNGFGPGGTDAAQDENYVAALICMAIPFAYFSLFPAKSHIVRVLLVAVLMVFATAMVVQQNPSRGGFLGLCAVALYCVLRSRRKAVGIGVMLAMTLGLVAVAGPKYWMEISTTGDFRSGTGSTRIELWKIGMRMWEANPLLGVGADNYRWNSGTFMSARQIELFNRDLTGGIIPHSLSMELLAEHGALGTFAVVMVLLGTWKGLGRVARERGDAPGRLSAPSDAYALACYADATRGGIIAILVTGQFLSLTYFSHLWLLIALGLAIPQIPRAPAVAGQANGASRLIPGTTGVGRKQRIAR